MRYLFSATAKGTVSAYKMSLPQSTRISTMVTHDGLQYNHIYHAEHVALMRKILKMRNVITKEPGYREA